MLDSLAQNFSQHNHKTAVLAEKNIRSSTNQVEVEPHVSEHIESREWVGSATRSTNYPLNR